MSQTPNGLRNSSQIYKSFDESYQDLGGQGTGAWQLVLKPLNRTRIYNIRYNDNSGAGGAISIAKVRRGYNPAAGSCPPSTPGGVKPTPAFDTSENDFAVICPDPALASSQPQQKDILAFEAPVDANEYVAQDGTAPVLVVGQLDELWIMADATVNYEIVYG